MGKGVRSKGNLKLILGMRRKFQKLGSHKLYKKLGAQDHRLKLTLDILK